MPRTDVQNPTRLPADVAARAVDRRCIAFFWTVACLSFMRYLPLLTSPFGTEQSDVFTAVFASYLKNMHLYGFGRLRGAPVFFSLPTARPEQFLYVNHPPTLFWIQFAIVEAFGLSERTLRIFPALATAVGHGLLGAALLRFAGLRVAIVAVAILFADRMSFVFGWMAGYEGPVLSAMIGAVWANEKRIDGGTGRMKVAAFIAFATAVDWAGAFILPALLIGEALRPKARRRFRDFVPAVIGVGLVVLADMAWVIWVRGGPSAAIQAIRAAAADANALAEASCEAWLLAQWTNLRLGHGDVLLGAAVPAILWSIARSRVDRGARWVIAFLIPAILNVLLFRSRAYDHQFWWYYSVPAVAVAIGLALDRIHRTSPAGKVIACGIFVVLLYAGARHTIDLRDRHRVPGDDGLVKTLNATLGPRDVFAAKDIESRMLFDVSWWPCSFDPVARTIDDAAEWWRTADIDADRMLILVWDHEVERRPALREELARHGPLIRTPQASIVVLKRQ